jgi:hypothetical protein
MAEISRRTLLGGAAAIAGLAAGAGLGLTKRVRHKVAVPPPPPPAALTDALARQRRLLAGYDVVATGYGIRPAVAAMRSDVVAHGDALHALLERYPGWRLSRPAPSASATPAGRTIAQLAAASTADARALTSAALGWPATEEHAAEVVPALGSIAACLASHAQVLA